MSMEQNQLTRDLYAAGYQGQKGYQLNTLIPLLLHFIWRSSMLL